MKNAGPFDEYKVKICVKMIEEAVGNSHEGFEIENHVADALFELLKLPIWSWWTIKKWEWKVARAMNQHWRCCGIKYE